MIASGPSMLEGSEKLDITSRETMKPISGYKPNTHLFLARNPDHDPATDTPEARESFPDRFEFVINTNADDIFFTIVQTVSRNVPIRSVGGWGSSA